MINSRSLEDLHPLSRSYIQSFISRCAGERVTILPTSTYRDTDAQNLLYARGRTRAGSIITNAKGGESFHNYHVAMDFVPLIGGKPLWTVFDSKGNMLHEWQVVANAAKDVGLEWAGNWTSFKEYDHVQYTGGMTLKDFQAGKDLGNYHYS